ncbi:hypothetical protein [Romboutsia sp.]|nr:hypothetical protein [Romboutsia sp.]HSQ89178.1 hypothetical protein [Romboutsia sp.]
MRKQLGVRIDENEYKKIKIMLVEENKTFQDYVLELIRKDMEEKENAK